MARFSSTANKKAERHYAAPLGCRKRPPGLFRQPANVPIFKMCNILKISRFAGNGLHRSPLRTFDPTRGGRSPLVLPPHRGEFLFPKRWFFDKLSGAALCRSALILNLISAPPEQGAHSSLSGSSSDSSRLPRSNSSFSPQLGQTTSPSSRMDSSK